MISLEWVKDYIDISSIDLENLTQEQKEIYENAYHSSFNNN